VHRAARIDVARERLFARVLQEVNSVNRVIASLDSCRRFAHFSHPIVAPEVP
jgi:hypothetical protein